MCLISYLYLDNGFNFYPYLDNSIIVHPHLDSSIIFYPHLWINIFSCFCATLTTIIQIKNNLTFRVTFTVSDQGRFSTYVHTYIHRTGVSSPPLSELPVYRTRQIRISRIIRHNTSLPLDDPLSNNSLR